ncbi:MAG TPA: hypothetical protein DEB31_07435 [Clostridiales bacterium]|nr:hypothetical protein [Clostridiales bacterium]
MAKYAEIERKELIEKMMWIARSVARRYASDWSMAEELTSIAYIGLVKAVDHFDSSYDTKLETFIAHCSRNEILMYFRKANHYLRELPFDSQTVAYDVTMQSESVLDEVMRGENGQEMIKILQCLNHEERRLISLRFGLFGTREHTQKELSYAFSVTQSSISKRLKRVLDKIKKSNEQSGRRMNEPI